MKWEIDESIEREVFNENIEQKLLCSMLLELERLDEIIYDLKEDDFYIGKHAIIFKIIFELRNMGKDLNLDSLINELKLTKKLELAGGSPYILKIASMLPSSYGIDFYKQQIKELSIRRKLIVKIKETLEMAIDLSQDVSFILSKVDEISKELEFKHSKDINNLPNLAHFFIDSLEKRRHGGDINGIHTGFEKLDELTNGFQSSEFIIIGARPSIGKTALALSMATNMSMKSKVSVGFFSLEMTAQAIVERIYSSETPIDSQKIRRAVISKLEIQKMFEITEIISDTSFYICDTPNIGFTELRAVARKMRNQGAQIIFIDYISLISPDDKTLPRHEQIAHISRMLKALARELNIPVIALSQLTRDSEGKVPNLSNLRESGSIEQDADLVMFIHRDRNKKADSELIATKLIIAKQRNGPTGEIVIAFEPKFVRFINYDGEFEEDSEADD